MDAVDPNSHPASPPDPPQDPPRNSMPQRIRAALHCVAILLDFGQHLLATVRQRAAAPTFTTIAAGFGTADLNTILAHLNRGLLRAFALERMLLARAATGRDLPLAPVRDATDSTPAAAPEPPRPPPSEPTGSDLPAFIMPTLEELEREMRCRPIGRIIVDICLDLAVMPGFCTGPFWTELFLIVQDLGGSIATLMLEKARRAEAFARQPERSRDTTWDWTDLRPDTIRKVLGFLIGEPPVHPVAPATGPP